MKAEEWPRDGYLKKTEKNHNMKIGLSSWILARRPRMGFISSVRKIKKRDDTSMSNGSADLERRNQDWLSTEASVRQRLQESGSEILSLRALFADASDSEWFWVLTHGRRKLPVLQQRLPKLPDPETQANYTGLSGDAGFVQAVRAARIFREEARRMGVAVGEPDGRLLDFGCGWGRITQVFLRDFEVENIVAVDVAPDTIDLFLDCGLGCQLQQVQPLPPLNLANDSIDLVTAYSVFSHLAEPVHLAWLKEFRRVLRPGGVLTVTTRPREFIDHVVSLRSQDEIPDFARGAAQVFVDADACYARYDAGDFCFDPAGAGGGMRNEFYGEALIPRDYVEEHWGKIFSEVGYISHLDHQSFDQNVLVARK